MPRALSRWPAALALFASLLGLTFAVLSASDYARHLDRQIHDVHCSFIPGLAAEAGASNACKVAMYSPYAALFRDRYWGGVPIALFAVGAFSFFAAFAAYLLAGGPGAPRKAPVFLALVGLTPLFASVFMGTISATKLGQFCKTCVGIYASSTLLAIAGIAAAVVDARAATAAPRPLPPTLVSGDNPFGPAPGWPDDRGNQRALYAPPPAPPRAPPRPSGSFLLVPVWALSLAVFAVTPALLYVTAIPSYAPYIASCGKLPKPEDTAKVLLHVASPGAVQPATLLVDPLCPDCKAFHQRLATEGLLDKLDITLVLFPLDNDCNWMLDRKIHAGACAVTKAILCSDHRALSTLEWAYDNQDDLLAAAKAGGDASVKSLISGRWPGLDACIDAKETKQRLDKMLRWVVANQLPVLTPQAFFGAERLCAEDTDMGLAYTVRRLAPALATK